MVRFRRNNSGFTVIELMVTVAVMLILLMIAMPSFEGLRQRSAIRGAGEQVLGFWNQARLEAAKRNAAGEGQRKPERKRREFCLGAARTADPADDDACDCFETDISRCALLRCGPLPGGTSPSGRG